MWLATSAVDGCCAVSVRTSSSAAASVGSQSGTICSGINRFGAVADHSSVLDDALLRRFDAVIAYYLPDPTQALELLRQHLSAVDTSEVSWNEVGDHVKGLSHARLVRAAESAAKRAILHEEESVSTAALITSLGELRRIHHVMGFGRTLRS